MRKRQIISTPQNAATSDEDWLDVGRAASVEVTSEENGYPIESALLAEATHGWRAVDSGAQTIRLIFDEPQRLRRIWLVFEDNQGETHTRVCVAMVSRSAAVPSEKSSVSSGTSANLTQSERSRTTALNSPESPYLN